MLKTEWIKPGAFVVPYGTMSAVELSLTDIMDKLVVDDWGQCKSGKFGSFVHMSRPASYPSKPCTPNSARSLRGERPDARMTSRPSFFLAPRPSLSDIALGHAMLEKAKATNIGQRLRFA